MTVDRLPNGDLIGCASGTSPSGLILAAQAIVIAVLTNSFSLPVTATFMNGPPGTAPELHHSVQYRHRLGRDGVPRDFGRRPADNRVAARLSLVQAQSAPEPQLRALDRVLLQLLDHDRADLSDHRHQRHRRPAGHRRHQRQHDPLRALQEKYEKPGKPSWLPFWFGSFAGIIPWIAIVIYVWAPGLNASPPGFVYGIIVSLFVFFNCFAVNMVLQYKKVGPWRDYLFGEKVYIILSLTAKALLAWQVFFPVLAPV